MPRYSHIGKDDLGGVRGADAVLAELLPLGKPAGAGRHDERGLPARPELRVHRGDDDVDVGDAAVGCPGLDAVEYPLILGLVIDGAGLDRGDVAPRVWLGGAE